VNESNRRAARGWLRRFAGSAVVLKPRKPILFLLRTFRQNVLSDSLLKAEQVFLRHLQVGLLAI
jgi:hypothetical protein